MHQNGVGGFLLHAGRDGGLNILAELEEVVLRARRQRENHKSTRKFTSSSVANKQDRTKSSIAEYLTFTAFSSRGVGSLPSPETFMEVFSEEKNSDCSLILKWWKEKEKEKEKENERKEGGEKVVGAATKNQDSTMERKHGQKFSQLQQTLSNLKCFFRASSRRCK